MKHTFIINIPSEQTGERGCKVTVDGLFMYKENTSFSDSVRSFVLEFYNGTHDFNECYGAYRITMNLYDKDIFFSDNSGMMRFYINDKKQKFYKSLAASEPDKKNRIPNYSAIAQFLYYGCVYRDYTILESVRLSNPNYYYIYNNNTIIKKSKKLTPMSSYSNKDISISKLISQALSHCEGEKGCTITGGIDSRSVLANLLDLGYYPQLAITGHDSQIDVQIAEEIANKAGLNLTVVTDEIDQDNWLDLSIEAADGQNGICGIYRLKKLAMLLQEKGIQLQFGGVAGEMYKNSFINQDFPFYYGKPRWKRFFIYKVGTFDFSDSLFGESLRAKTKKLPSQMLHWLEKHKGKNKADAYLNAGYEIMQYRCNLVVNMFENHITSYNPLMERKLASYAFGINPYELEMQAFQRKEVSEHFKSIKTIKTDRNLTCDYKKRYFEFIQSYFFLIKVASQRVFFRNKVDIRIDNCFEEGHKCKEFFEALNYTKKMGILNPEVNIADVPAGLSDRLFTIGTFFSNSL